MAQPKKIEENKSEQKIVENLCKIVNEKNEIGSQTWILEQLDIARAEKMKELLTYTKMFGKGIKASSGEIAPRHSRMLSSMMELMEELNDNWSAIQATIELEAEKTSEGES